MIFDGTEPFPSNFKTFTIDKKNCHNLFWTLRRCSLFIWNSESNI
jgi:hypothetical protein